jgi:acetate---CoA ligase (ADP-forming)
MIGARRAIERLFRPRSVAVVGASEDPEKLSGQPLRNLLALGYAGGVYAVNPRVEEVSGIRSYESLSQIREPVDVAIICLSGALAVEAAEECATLNIPVAIIASSGFAEVGTREGRELQERLTCVGERGTRIVGPNCNGIYNVLDHVSIGYNVTHSMALRPGNVAVLSHSGALFSSIVALGEELGFGLGYTYFVSAGNEADLDLLDYMEYVVEDPSTTVVALILDGIRDARRFRSLCGLASEGGKRIVALKIGQSEPGIRATLAHSSRLAGSSRSYRALLAECGVFQTPTLESLVGTCAVLSKYRVDPPLNLIGISTSGAGCAVMADTAERYGVRFPPLSPGTISVMDQRKGFATPMNPYDVGASGPDSMSYMVGAMAGEPGGNLALFYSTILQTERMRRLVSEQYARACEELGRPPFLVLAPGPLTPEETGVYRDHDIVVFGSSDVAFQTVRAIKDAAGVVPDKKVTLEPLHRIEGTEGTALDRESVLKLLKEVGVPFPTESVAKTPEELAGVCRSVGYPVIVKGLSTEATHKSDAGLVWPYVTSDEEAAWVAQHANALIEDGTAIDELLVQEEVRGEAEVMVGINNDPDLGFVLVLGSGGKYSEILDDIATCTIPSSRQRIRDALMTTKVGKVLSGSRGNGLSPDGVVNLAFQLQRLVSGNECVLAAIDLNPLIVSPQRIAAVDARIVLKD